MRCSRPGVPGTAHGRAPSSLRAYGRNWPSSGGSVAKSGSIGRRSAVTGTRHGSLELARNRSLSTITGVR